MSNLSHVSTKDITTQAVQKVESAMSVDGAFLVGLGTYNFWVDLTWEAANEEWRKEANKKMRSLLGF